MNLNGHYAWFTGPIDAAASLDSWIILDQSDQLKCGLRLTNPQNSGLQGGVCTLEPASRLPSAGQMDIVALAT